MEQQAEELNKSRHLQTALFEISELCHSEDDMGAFFQGLHQTIASLMYAESVLVAILDRDSEDVKFVYFSDSFEPDHTIDDINAKGQEVLRMIRPSNINTPCNESVLATAL